MNHYGSLKSWLGHVASCFVFSFWFTACGHSHPRPVVNNLSAEVAKTEPSAEKTAASLGGAGDSTPTESPQAKTLLERLGGKDVLASVVDTVAKRAAQDPRTGKLFARTTGLTNEQFRSEFFRELCVRAGGGQCSNTEAKGFSFRVTERQFDALIEALKAALDENGVGEPSESELFAVVAPMKDELVSGKKFVGGKR